MAEDGNRELSQVESAVHQAVSGVLERFDLADDEQIIKALAKRVTQGFTYKVNGKHGLSSAGVLWATREFAKQGEVYRVIGDPKIQQCPLDPECINIWVTVQRFFVNPATGQEIALDSTFGHKRMSRKTKRYKDESGTDFDMVEDPEFTTKGITKAERNGKVKLMPKDSVTNMIVRASGQGAPASAPAKPANRTQPPKPAGGQAAPAGGAPPTDASKAPPAQGAASKPASPPAQPPTQPPAQPPTQPPAQPPAQQQTPPPTTPPPQPPAADKPKMSKEVMVQKLDAVCKLVFQTQDGAVARQRLAAITGKASPSDLNEEEIKIVGNAINAVAKKTAVIEGNNVIKIADKSILWKGPDLPPPQEAPAEGGGSEDMF